MTFSEPLLVRRRHPRRGHCRQLLCLRLGAGHRQDQRHHGGLGGHLPRPFRRRDGQEPEGWRRRRWPTRHASHGSRQGEADDVSTCSLPCFATRSRRRSAVHSFTHSKKKKSLVVPTLQLCCLTKMSNLATKFGQISPKWDKYGTF